MDRQEVDFDPTQILWAPRPHVPDVAPVKFTRGPQPGFREGAPVDKRLGTFKLGVKIRFGARFRHFRHSYAPLRERHIRVLLVRPGNPGDKLELDLLSFPFEEPYNKIPPYEALSYEWDDGPAVFPIILRDWTMDVKERFPLAESHSPSERRKIIWEQVRFVLHRSAGTTAFIQANLRNALEHLRSKNKDEYVRLWADALCINQIDNDEKANQIAQMGAVYNRAFNVRIWLGGESDQSNVAMDYVRELQGENALKNMFAVKSSTEEMAVKWPAIFELMTSRWFSRRWVIQEIALAQKASVYCGQKKVTWSDFSSAISTFMDRAKPENLEQMPLQPVDGHPGKRRLTSEGLRTLKGSGANALVAAYTDLVQPNDKGEIIEKRKNLEELISTLTAFDCGDPRDLIYAVLSIAAHDPQKDIRPNENKSLLQLYTEFIRYCVDTSLRLDMICRHWAPKNTAIVKQVSKSDKRRFESTLPTWIKTLEGSTYGTPDTVFRGQKEAESLVGPPSRLLYSASGSRPPQVTFGHKPIADKPVVLKEEFDGTATVRGIKLGVIQELSARLIPGIIPREALEIGGWKYSLRDVSLTVDQVPDKLWRTLVANKTPEGQGPLPNYRLHCLKMLQLEDIHGDIHISKIMARKDIDPSLSHFLQRVRDVTFNRRLFLAGEAKGLFGLCPKQAQKGDVLCILYGCSVPVLLRPQKKRPIFGLDPKCNNDPAEPTPSPKAIPNPTVDAKQEPETTGDTQNPLDNLSNSNPWQDQLFNAPPMGFGLTPPATDRAPRRAATFPESRGASKKRKRNGIKGSKSKSPSADNGNQAPKFVEGEFYELIGECYVDHKMDGEACPRNESLAWEENFTLI